MTEPITGDDTATRLVTAAAAVFAERGYDGAGVAEIARRAGLTTGAIYSRFSGKAELLAAAISAFTADEFDHLFAEHDFNGDTTSLLNRVGLHLVTRHPDRGAAILLEAFVAARRDPEVRDVLRAHLAERARRLGELVEGGKAAGVVDPTLDTNAIVHFAHAVGLGFLAYEAIDMPHPAVDAWRDVISRVVGAMETVIPAAPISTISTHQPITEPAT